jgi:heptosyltransferase II
VIAATSICPPRRILVRGVNWLGDAVMTSPALLRLREKFPDAHITLLGPEKLKDLWRHHPAVNETISFAPGESFFAVAKKLRTGKFDLALVLPNSPRSALEVFLAGIPQRIGYVRPWRNFFLTQTVASRAEAVKMQKRSVKEIKILVADNPKIKNQKSKLPAAAHQIYEYLHLAAALGANPEPLAPQLHVDKLEVLGLDWSLPQNSRRADFIIGLNPGAEYGSAKRWPVENFAAAANELYRRVSCEFLIFGGKNDVSLAEQLCELLPAPKANGHVVVLAGKTDLRDLMTGLKMCRVLLTNDTGPMHVAAALGTPVVVPFGSTSPELTGPGLPGDSRNHLLKSDAPCSPCFLRECPIDFRCMNGISIELAVEAVLQIVR